MRTYSLKSTDERYLEATTRNKASFPNETLAS